jgi:TolB-like protein/tetratricopeptide (TPR) repeat protein
MAPRLNYAVVLPLQFATFRKHMSRCLLVLALGVTISNGGGRGAQATGLGSELGMASLGFLVLPFDNTSGDSAQDYIAAGITSDLTSGLSRIKDSIVIAGGSARAISSQSLAVVDMGRRLGVSFVIHGNASMKGARLRVSATLFRAQDEEQLWSEQFEADFVALRDLERKIVTSVARHLDAVVVDAGPPVPLASATSPAALDSLLRARAIASRPTAADTISEAGRLFSAALRDPVIGAEAKGDLAAIHLAVALNSRGNAPAFDLRECDRLVQEALASNPNNARALNTLGALRRATGKPREALAAYEAAVAADRNDANAHAQIGRLKIDLGDAKSALPHIELALRLSPLDAQRSLWFTFAGLALLSAGEPGARPWLENAVAAGPQFVTALVFLAAAQQLDGHDDDARRTMGTARQMSPTLSIARVEQQFAPNDRGGPRWSRIRDSLRQAGLPN